MWFIWMTVGLLHFEYFGITVHADACLSLCNCMKLTRKVDCNGRNLTKIPHDIPLDTLELDLGRNNFTQIKEGDIHYFPDLIWLNLSTSGIRYIERGSFKNCSSLMELFLHHNEIDELQDNVFEGLGSLQYLYLEHNRINRLQPNVFTGLKKLTSLRLGSNKLVNIEAHTFHLLGKLHWLNLDSNKLKQISANAFQGLGKLKNLIMTGNYIDSISEGSFNGLSGLNFLHLMDCSISSIENGSFIGLDKLKYLYLNLNRLQRIPRNAFRGAENIRTLNLSANDIHNIEDGSFEDLVSMRYLHLESNKMTEITKNMFRGLHQLRVLKLFGNKIAMVEIGSFNDSRLLENLYMEGDSTTCSCTMRTALQDINVRGLKCDWKSMRYCDVVTTQGTTTKKTTTVATLSVLKTSARPDEGKVVDGEVKKFLIIGLPILCVFGIFIIIALVNNCKKCFKKKNSETETETMSEEVREPSTSDRSSEEEGKSVEKEKDEVDCSYELNERSLQKLPSASVGPYEHEEGMGTMTEMRKESLESSTSISSCENGEKSVQIEMEDGDCSHELNDRSLQKLTSTFDGPYEHEEGMVAETDIRNEGIKPSTSNNGSCGSEEKPVQKEIAEVDSSYELKKRCLQELLNGFDGPYEQEEGMVPKYTISRQDT